MKGIGLLSVSVFLSSSLAFAASAAKVAIVVNGSPCTGGPTDCSSLQDKGMINVESQAGKKSSLSIDSSGLTIATLVPGRYKFSYKTGEVGSSQVVEKDVVDLGSRLNFIDIQYDTGIR